MTDEHPLRRFNKTAEKWRDLAEKRRQYFEELHQSGRWKYYYTETLFYRRLGKAAELVDLWEPVLKARVTELPSAPKSAPQSPPISSAMSPATSSPPPPVPSPMRQGTLPRRRAI
jgi:uncharacterized repeat protein (TIGR03809 family)